LIESLPLVEKVVDPFGSGPWPCRNPLPGVLGEEAILEKSR
jgi:hypothetical protein